MTLLRWTAIVLGVAATSLAFAQTPPAAKAAGERHELQVGTRAWKGDLDFMEKRRIIRALVPYSKTFYYVENRRARGFSYDVFTAFEDDLNKKLKSKTLKVRVLFLPVGREEIVAKLNDGWGDLMFADLTVTPERQKVADDPQGQPTTQGGARRLREDACSGNHVRQFEGQALCEGSQVKRNG